MTASDARKAHIDALASALERLNPNKKALRSELINGEWELLYTTSGSILGSNRPWPFRPIGPIYQTIDVERRRARNRETFPFFNAVDADVTPTSASGVDVQFVRFTIFGVVGVDAPASARGALDTTYLDSELRVGRGDKGNLFVLAMRDREAKIKEEARSLRVALEEAARRHEASIVAAEDIMRRTRNATEDPPDAPTKDANSITAATQFAAVGVGDRLVRLQARVAELADRERRAFVRRQELAREVDVARTTAEEERARRISAEAAARETMDRLKRDTWAARETASRLEAENTSLVTKLRAALGGIGGFGAANGWESPAALTLSTSRDDG